MAGFRGNSKLQLTQPSDTNAANTRRLDSVFDSATSERLNRLIRDENLTVNAIASACWALLIANLTGQNDLVFATTVSGRSLPLDGLPNLVGLFANVVPVRAAKLTGSATLRQWLAEIRDNQFDTQLNEHLSLVEIGDLCQLDPGRVLGETLLVVENFPLQLGGCGEGQLVMSDYKSGTTSSYPLNCYVIPGERWQVAIEFNTSLCGEETAAQLLEQFKRVVDSLLQFSLDARLPEFRQSLQLESLAGIVLEGHREDRIQRQLSDLHLEDANEVELQLTEIWEEVLGISPIAREEGFFDLGGKSMSAVRLLAKVRDKFGVDLAPTVLIEQPTIRQLAQLISGGQRPVNQGLLKFNRQDSGDPVVCLHVGGGYATYYRFLAQQLPDHPVVGLQPKGLEGEVPLRSFPELATWFIDRLDQSFESRNYHLVGYCMARCLLWRWCASSKRTNGLPFP